VIEKAENSEVARNMLNEAVLLGYDIAAKENCLGMFARVQ
jgi:hypothetical protein